MAVENSMTSHSLLESSLTDLILKPKSSKISRPPNAFMIFAREHRKIFASKHPTKTNKKISTLLGECWRSIDLPTREQYYLKAKLLDALHRRRYPGYTYSPREARLKKLEKSKMKALGKSYEAETTIKEEIIDRSETRNLEAEIKDLEQKVEIPDVVPSSPGYVPNNPQYFDNQTASEENDTSAVQFTEKYIYSKSLWRSSTQNDHTSPTLQTEFKPVPFISSCGSNYTNVGDSLSTLDPSQYSTAVRQSTSSSDHLTIKRSSSPQLTELRCLSPNPDLKCQSTNSSDSTLQLMPYQSCHALGDTYAEIEMNSREKVPDSCYTSPPEMRECSCHVCVSYRRAVAPYSPGVDSMWNPYPMGFRGDYASSFRDPYYENYTLGMPFPMQSSSSLFTAPCHNPPFLPQTANRQPAPWYLPPWNPYWKLPAEYYQQGDNYFDDQFRHGQLSFNRPGQVSEGIQTDNLDPAIPKENLYADIQIKQENVHENLPSEVFESYCQTGDHNSNLSGYAHYCSSNPSSDTYESQGQTKNRSSNLNENGHYSSGIVIPSSLESSCQSDYVTNQGLDVHSQYCCDGVHVSDNDIDVGMEQPYYMNIGEEIEVSTSQSPEQQDISIAQTSNN